MRKTWQDYGREWLDTLVVAISVAMAFRAYFFEPFNIPTGSMMPTLYGNHSEPCENPGVWQTTPLKWLNWLLSGRDYKEFTAPCDGTVVAFDRGDGRSEFSVVSPYGVAAGAPVTLPADAQYVIAAVASELSVHRCGFAALDEDRRRATLMADGGPGVGRIPARVRKGQVLWRGYDTTGDFIFVNRWRWNFRAPSRGDVMVFATTGIGGLAQGTHYIKRMTGLPGETVWIERPDVFIDGERIAPLKPMTGARGERTPEPSAGTNGMAGPVALGAGEYFACGDNSDNSFDSRYWGAVPEGNLKGIGSFVFWPIVNPRWGVIK